MVVLVARTHAAAELGFPVLTHHLTGCCCCSAAAPAAGVSPAQAWEQPGSGLILNERLINCPPQLAPPLVQALFSEIGWATEDEPTQVGGQKGGAAVKECSAAGQRQLMLAAESAPVRYTQQHCVWGGFVAARCSGTLCTSVTLGWRSSAEAASTLTTTAAASHDSSRLS